MVSLLFYYLFRGAVFMDCYALNLIYWIQLLSFSVRYWVTDSTAWTWCREKHEDDKAKRGIWERDKCPLSFYLVSIDFPLFSSDIYYLQGFDVLLDYNNYNYSYYDWRLEVTVKLWRLSLMFFCKVSFFSLIPKI